MKEYLNQDDLNNITKNLYLSVINLKMISSINSGVKFLNDNNSNEEKLEEINELNDLLLNIYYSLRQSHLLNDNKECLNICESIRGYYGIH